MEAVQWREEVGGTFVADTLRFRLAVRRSHGSRPARFLVLARHAGGIYELIAAGTASDLRDGMQAAEELLAQPFDVPALADHVVIVVDDDPAVRAAVADSLRDGGYEVKEAASGEGALRRLERTARAAVVVADVDLGDGMNGLELANAVRRMRPITGVLLMSGTDLRPARVVEGEFLAKPFSVDELLERVAGAFARMRTARVSSAH